MNNRIKELAEQALQLVADKHTNGDESRLNTDSYHVKDLIQEKFAELIVKELITICTPDISGRLDGLPYETADDFDRGFIDGQDCCVELIKKHFGVEE